MVGQPRHRLIKTIFDGYLTFFPARFRVQIIRQWKQRTFGEVLSLVDRAVVPIGDDTGVTFAIGADHERSHQSLAVFVGSCPRTLRCFLCAGESCGLARLADFDALF